MSDTDTRACQASGHLYRTMEVGLADGYASIVERCEVCKMKRRTVIEPKTGMTVKRIYTYPPGWVNHRRGLQ